MKLKYKGDLEMMKWKQTWKKKGRGKQENILEGN
jgi:hypothetical protein